MRFYLAMAVAAFALLSSPGNAQEENAVDAEEEAEQTFGPTTWGMSIAALKEISPDLHQEGSVLGQEVTIAGDNAIVYYKFVNDQLTSVLIAFNESHTDYNAFITDFHSISELLQKKYGAPAASGQGWGNELFKEDRGSWGTAVAYGHLKYRAEYEVPGMTITHVLNGDNFEISHAVRYASTRIGHLELQEMEREHLDGL